MADDMQEILRKRIAAQRAASKLNLPLPPIPGRGFAPGGSSTVGREAYLRDFGRTMPHQPPLEVTAQEAQQEVIDSFGRDFREDDRLIMIREQMDRLNEAQGGGLAKLMELQQSGSSPFTSRDGTTYYVEPEGKFLMIRSANGDLEAIEMKTIGSMLHTQVQQMRAAGIEPGSRQEAEAEVAPVVAQPELSEGQRQSQAMQSLLNRRIADRVNARTYEAMETVAAKMTDDYVAASSTPEKQAPAHEVEAAERGKGEMVRFIAEYGRDEGKNMVRELREHGGEIEQHGLSYKVEGETFSRTHPDKTTFDFNAKEIEQAVDTRQEELGAIDRWENYVSPARELQDRLSAEIGQGNERQEADKAERLAKWEAAKPVREAADEIAGMYANGKALADDIQDSEKQEVNVSGAIYTLDGDQLSRTKGGETVTMSLKEVSAQVDKVNRDEAYEADYYPPTRDEEPQIDAKEELRQERLNEQDAAEDAARREKEDAIAADDKRILDERFQRDLLPDDGSEPELTSRERKEAEEFERRSDAYDLGRELGWDIADYGKERGTDLISELRENGGEIEHDGSTYSLEEGTLSRTKDGETTEHYAMDVQEGLDNRRSQDQEQREQEMSPYERMEAGMSRPESVTEEQWEALSKQYAHDLMMENTPEEFTPGTEEYAHENDYGDYVPSEKELADHALGREIAGYGKERGTDLLEEVGYEGSQPVEYNGATYAYTGPLTFTRTENGVTTKHNYTELREGIDEARAEQALTDPLKAQIAALQEKLAAYEQPQTQDAKEAVSSTPEKTEDRQQSADQQQTPAAKDEVRESVSASQEQGKSQVDDKMVADQIEGRSKGNWFDVTAKRLEARKEAGEEVADKPFVARARESEVAAVKSVEAKQQLTPSQTVH